MKKISIFFALVAILSLFLTVVARAENNQPPEDSSLQQEKQIDFDKEFRENIVDKRRQTMEESMKYMEEQGKKKSLPDYLYSPVSADESASTIYFTENKGQADERVKYYIDGTNYRIYFTEDAVYYHYFRIAKANLEDDVKSVLGKEISASKNIDALLYKSHFIGHNEKVKIYGSGQRIGTLTVADDENPPRLISDIATYPEITYAEIYKGIDLVYSILGERHLKYKIIVKPGADPGSIKLAYEGIEALNVGDDGELIVKTRWYTFKEIIPAVYEIDERIINVPGKFVAIKAEADAKGNPGDSRLYGYGFNIGKYNHKNTLIIDHVLFSK